MSFTFYAKITVEKLFQSLSTCASLYPSLYSATSDPSSGAGLPFFDPDSLVVADGFDISSFLGAGTGMGMNMGMRGEFEDADEGEDDGAGEAVVDVVGNGNGHLENGEGEGEAGRTRSDYQGPDPRFKPY